MASAALQPFSVCPLCPHERTANLHFNRTTWLKHIQLCHAHQPGFRITCGVSGCQRTYTNFGTFKNHVYDLHPAHADVTATSSTLDLPSVCDLDVDYLGFTEQNHEEGDQGGDEGGSSHTLSHQSLQRSSALFLMGCKEKNKLTQESVQWMIEGFTTLNQQRLHSLHMQVCEIMSTDLYILPMFGFIRAGA